MSNFNLTAGVDIAFPIPSPALIEGVLSSTAQKPIRNLRITDNINSFSNVISVNIGISDEYNQILGCLSPPKPQERSPSVLTDRLGGVGNWLLETGGFGK